MKALPDVPDTVVVVDVANVMGSRADGWWRDRAGAALRLYEEIAALATRGIPSSRLPAWPPPLPTSPPRPTPATSASAPASPGTPTSSAAPTSPAPAAPAPASSAPPDAPAEETQLRNRCRDSDTERAIEDGVGEVGDAVAGVTYPWFVLVLEGRARDAVERIEASHPRVRVVRAAGSGDDAIVTETASLAASGASCLVVTADRELRRRCVAAGASVVGPSWLLGLF